MGNLIKTMNRKIIQENYNFNIWKLRLKDSNKAIKYKKLSKIRSNSINPKKSIFKSIKDLFIWNFIIVSISSFSFLFIECNRRNILHKILRNKIKN